jgi:NAD(P)-dependent dehydrogenase (short-subunit alcohol dehydrogenase family)
LPEPEATARRLNQLGPGEAVAVPTNAARKKSCSASWILRWSARAGKISWSTTPPPTPYHGPIFETPISAWDKTFEVNLRGYFVLSLLAYQRWLTEHGSCVVNFASTGGYRPAKGVGAYDVSKAGVIMLTRHMAEESNGRVRFNCVAPGLTRTQQAKVIWENKDRLAEYVARNPLKRIGEPEDVAAVIGFVVSDAAAYVNGQVITVNGGPLGRAPRRAPSPAGAARTSRWRSRRRCGASAQAAGDGTRTPARPSPSAGSRS